MSKAAFRALVPLVVLGALLFRLPGLSIRPMHHDEANQAMKFGALLETGEYRYDPADHHGPSLYYLTWVLAKALGRTTTASLDEAALRLLPALFGAGTVVLLLLLAGAVGRAAALAAGALAALSPAFTYYSRFYIQETVFVFFIAAFVLALWKYRERPTGARAAAAGSAAGLMFATKETSVIVFAAVGAAILLTRSLNKAHAGGPDAGGKPRLLRDLALGFGAAAFAAAVLFSSFFSHPRGILDSVLALGNYFVKSGDPGFHAHPAGYYIGLLTYSRNGGLVWSESIILALACLGIIGAVRKRGEFPVAAALASIITAATLSLVAYKTPWNALPFHFGFVILAGLGANYLFRSIKNIPLKIVAGTLLGLGLLHLAWQSGQANFRYAADPRNPYVYAQTSSDYLKLVKRVDDVAAAFPGPEKPLIKVVSGPYETWPLPWSLRRYTRVGYWQDAAAAGGFEGADLVIASEAQAVRIRPLIENAFHEEFYGLRPDVLLALFIRNNLWERFLDGEGALMDLSIVIPALNEERKIAPDITAAAFFFGEAGLKGEVLVVDDGSSDRTFHNALTAMVPDAVPRRVIRLPRNSGKGAAVKAGVRETTGAVVLYADSGTCIPYEDALPAYARIRAGELDIAIGSRTHRESVICRNRPFYRRIVSRLFRQGAHLITGLPKEFGDSQCGFKLYRGDLARDLFAGLETPGFAFELEFLIKAKRRGFRIEEFPIHWSCDLDTRLNPSRQSLSVWKEMWRVRKVLRLDAAK